ncbi:MAG: acyl-CoA synthetase [Acidimicrobiia bacterium]|nr:acyl-CoA synthetase [Acidimicrobiia bacterium]
MHHHFADIFEAIADAVPDRDAIVQGDHRVTYGDYDDRAARVASALTDAGLGHDSKLGMFLYNCAEYGETQYAGFKIRAVPVNVNYRYLDAELLYLLENSDSEAVVYHRSLGDRIARVAPELPDLRLIIEVDDEGDGGARPVVDGAVRYEDVIAGSEPASRIERDPDDIYMLYTGGTTGMPKGVMYPMGQLTEFFLTGGAAFYGLGPEAVAPDAMGAVARSLAADDKLLNIMPACPLMHGTGCWIGLLSPHLFGSTSVLLESASLDADQLWQVVERERVNIAVIVGDAFARPMLRSLDAARDRAESIDLSSLAMILSTGAMFSSEIKTGLLDHAPDLMLLDVLGSTEGSMAQTITAKGLESETAKFGLLPDAVVLDDDLQPVEPGSDVVGHVAVSGGNVPLGYYKDPEKSARTFPVINGVRHSIPGDMATVAADGSVTLLGRGSHCINTGGEKVFPEEVEEALKTHEAVADSLVFGVDDDRFGQRVMAVASLDGDHVVTASDLIAYAKTRLSSFKAPKEVMIVATVPRAPNGKADYEAARALVAAEPG